jgi:uncharacterized membrane protein
MLEASFIIFIVLIFLVIHHWLFKKIVKFFYKKQLGVKEVNTGKAWGIILLDKNKNNSLSPFMIFLLELLINLFWFIINFFVFIIIFYSFAQIYKLI